jgi:uncharacterized membrane protein (UPF0182 family)
MRRRWLLIGLASVALALLLGRGAARIYTDYLWYASLGAADVWRAKYGALLTLRVAASIAATLFVFANLYAVRQSVVSLVLPRRIGNLDIGEEVPRRRLTLAAATLSALTGVALAWSQNDWSGYFAARFGEPFGESDPYFAADLGFFVHRLPFELSLFRWALIVVLVVIGIVLVLYALTPSLRWEQGSLYVSGYVRRHFAMLAGVLLLALAWHYRLQMYTILGDGHAIEGAFGYLDHRVGIPANLVLSVVTLGAGLTVLWAGWSGQMRLAFAALTGVLVAVFAARQVAPFVARRAAERDPSVRERPYEATRAAYSRRAFAADRVAVDDSILPFHALSDAAPYVPIWDEGALRQADERALAGTAVGWTVSDTGIVALLPVGAAGGVNGFVATTALEGGAPARATDVRADAGAPLIIPDSNARTRVVADSADVIAAPRLSGVMTRVAHALAMQDFRIWLGALPSPSPKVVSRRGVRERVRALAPLFVQGSSITPVWIRGSLSWAVPLYSASSTYPLSRRYTVAGAERAYFQHAATALVDAATGRTTFVTDSVADPIAGTWMRHFPRLFTRAGALPATIRRQLPPPRESARAQATAFGRFGQRAEADVIRQIPADEGADSALASSPQPVIGVPGAGTTSYVIPLLDHAERLRGVFVALGGATRRSVWIPAGESAPVWSEALDRLRAADTTLSSALARGYVRVIPLAGEVAFVQPRYEWRGGSPRLAYVSALVGDTVRTGRTLLQLAGRMPPTPAVAGDLRSRVAELYEQMRRAMARGDWAAYGRAFEALGELLAQPRE